MRPLAVAVVASLAVVPLASRGAAAQLMASERASVSQVVDGTRATVEYSRPRARGRTALFGRQVKWGETWTPGANGATTLAVTKDVTVNGAAVPKGKYSVWFVPAEQGDWEVVLDPDTTRFHTQRPSRRDGQLRFAARPERRPFAEVLTWHFPEVGAGGTTLALQWDSVYVPLRIAVTPSFRTAVDDAAAAPLVGRYAMRSTRPPGAPARRDTSADAPETPPDSMSFTIRHERGELRAVMDPPLYSSESGYRDWMLLPKGDGIYLLARLDGGQLVEMLDGVALHFDVASGRATGFEVRTASDMLLASGRRLP